MRMWGERNEWHVVKGLRAWALGGNPATEALLGHVVNV